MVFNVFEQRRIGNKLFAGYRNISVNVFFCDFISICIAIVFCRNSLAAYGNVQIQVITFTILEGEHKIFSVMRGHFLSVCKFDIFQFAGFNRIRFAAYNGIKRYRRAVLRRQSRNRIAVLIYNFPIGLQRPTEEFVMFGQFESRNLTYRQQRYTLCISMRSERCFLVIPISKFQRIRDFFSLGGYCNCLIIYQNRISTVTVIRYV